MSEIDDSVESTIFYLCVWYFDRAYDEYGFYVASCRVYSPMRETKSEGADFKLWVCLYIYLGIK